MSRPIKFRAWDKEEKEYYYDVEHTYDFFCSGHGCYAESFGEVLKQPDRFIVEQYTGLKDKNGKEIYEGDIVCFGNVHYPMLVVWYKTAFRLKNDVGIGCPIAELELCEVIGNIHENPELVGDEE